LLNKLVAPKSTPPTFALSSIDVNLEVDEKSAFEWVSSEIL